MLVRDGSVLFPGMRFAISGLDQPMDQINRKQGCKLKTKAMNEAKEEEKSLRSVYISCLRQYPFPMFKEENLIAIGLSKSECLFLC